MSIQELDTTLVRTDGGTQQRPRLDHKLVDEYATLMTEGKWDWEAHTLPVVFFDGAIYWHGDGEHRLRACAKAEFPFRADVRPGTLQDALWFSFSANASHGLRRTNDAKRNSVAAALAHPNAATMSDREIARHCGVSNTFVSNMRNELTTGTTPEKQARKTNVARIGKGSPIQQIDKWWKQAPQGDKQAIYQRILSLYQAEFARAAV